MVKLGGKNRKADVLGTKASMLARMSQQVYTDRTRREDIDGYVYMPHVSNDENATYKRGRDIIVASRGTRLGEGVGRAWEDSKANLNIIAGTFDQSERFNRDLKHTRALREQYGNGFKVQFTGHSLGGQAAATKGAIYGAQATTFNPGSGLFTSKLLKKRQRNCDKGDQSDFCRTTNYKIDYDLLSMLGSGYGTTVGKDGSIWGGLSNHSMSNYISAVPIKR